MSDFNAVTKLTSTFDDAFRSLIKNDAVRVVTSRVLSSGTGEFVDEYFAQMLSPAVENIAFDGDQKVEKFMRLTLNLKVKKLK